MGICMRIRIQFSLCTSKLHHTLCSTPTQPHIASRYQCSEGIAHTLMYRCQFADALLNLLRR